MGIKSRLFQYYFPEKVAEGSINRMSSSSGVVLMYHEVLPDDVELPAWTIVRQSDFRWQMEYLRKHFDVISMDQAMERTAGKQKSTRPFAVVTFDDGYRGNLEIVLPLMESIELPFTVYVATKAIIDNQLYWYDQIINLLNAETDLFIQIPDIKQAETYKITRSAKNSKRWAQVQSLLSRLKKLTLEERNGAVEAIISQYAVPGTAIRMLDVSSLQRLALSSTVTIGAHTHCHDLLDQLGPAEVIDTIKLADNHLKQIVGYYPKHFAYPNGNFNDLVIDKVRDSGYATAVTTKPGVWSKDNSFLQIPRLAVGRFETKALFKARLSGYL